MASASAFDLAPHAWYRRVFVHSLARGPRPCRACGWCGQGSTNTSRREDVFLYLDVFQDNRLSGWRVNFRHICTSHRDVTFIQRKVLP